MKTLTTAAVAVLMAITSQTAFAGNNLTKAFNDSGSCLSIQRVSGTHFKNDEATNLGKSSTQAVYDFTKRTQTIIKGGEVASIDGLTMLKKVNANTVTYSTSSTPFATLTAKGATTVVRVYEYTDKAGNKHAGHTTNKSSVVSCKAAPGSSGLSTAASALVGVASASKSDKSVSAK